MRFNSDSPESSEDLQRYPHSLASYLQDTGFQTVAIVDGGYMSKGAGLEIGFEQYIDVTESAPPGTRRVADRKGGGLRSVLDEADRWLRNRTSSPFFMFLHTYDVHCPYEPEEAYSDLFTGGRSAPMDIRGLCGKDTFNQRSLTVAEAQWIRDQYDAGLRQTDAILGHFLDSLTQADVMENTLVIIISDHGESLGEHEWYGHNRLYPEQLSVPWIMAGPMLPAGKVIDQPSQLVDLLPTVLDYLEVPLTGKPILGVSMLPAILGETGVRDQRLRVCEDRRQRALLRGPWILIQDKSSGDLISLQRPDLDPLGETDFLVDHPDVADTILSEWNALAAQYDW